MTIRTYSDLTQLPTFEERLEYLRLFGTVGDVTFGYDRVFNQMLYQSREWKHVRRDIIARDLGCDLGVEGYDIVGEPIYIHHINPLRIDDIRESTEYLFNPEYLICTTDRTHRYIHYGIETKAPIRYVERAPNDTSPWRSRRDN